MKINKTQIDKDEVRRIVREYKASPLEAAIMVRRSLTGEEDALYHFESDVHFMHQPFLLPDMEEAVERINAAMEGNEAILIFGDRDVDGVTATAVLYGYLKRRGADVSYRLPTKEEPYGLNEEAIETFAARGGALIITVDCGITNVAEVETAREKGIDVVITDHHNPQEVLPDAVAVVDPKVEASKYPFHDISGAAVAYKLTRALELSRLPLYGRELAILHVGKEGISYRIDAVKMRNLVKVATLTLSLKAEEGKASLDRLCSFFSATPIFVWDVSEEERLLKELFGTSVDFSLTDMRKEVSFLLPKAALLSSFELLRSSTRARYIKEEKSVIAALYNIFVSAASAKLKAAFPEEDKASYEDLSLVGIAALADIMPMKDENRIFLKNALSSINSNSCRRGIRELLSRADMDRPITSGDLSWKLIPELNATGRMEDAETSLKLLLSEDARERETLADRVCAINEERKTFVREGEAECAPLAEKSVAEYSSVMSVVMSRRINRGVTGLLASRFMQKFRLPAIVLTFMQDGSVVSGSMRSMRGLVAPDFLSRFKSFFLNFGGHNAAAGFSLKREDLASFLFKLKEESKTVKLEEDEGEAVIDAEIPEEYLNGALLETVKKFEPYGEGAGELVFFSPALKVMEARQIGRGERLHLKIFFRAGNSKFPAIFWGEGERLGKEVKEGKFLSVLYTVEANYFGGHEAPQIVIKDLWEAK